MIFQTIKDLLNEATIISAKYARLSKAERKGILSYDEIDQKMTKLLYQIFNLIEDIENRLAIKLAS